ncbi:hypothetical protein ACHAWO_013712 [Cyclotella atomus]|uniref:Uncharacterized protein n=1 Tax=Cyclotella atomus TaxID=382360 RepID=A0ABD3PF38_9STRA
MSDTESTATNEKLAPLLSKNRRIYIKHNFNRDGIHRFLNAEWQGVWHLACVSSPWDEESGTFEVLWSRNGHYEKHTMKYKPHLIQPFHPNPKSILLIEDDDKTYDKPSHIHYAHFHSFGKGNDNINIRWESTREVEEIDLSRVCLDIRLMGRRRKTNFYSDESVKLEKGGEGGGAYKKKRGRKKDTVIELLDSSDYDDDET